MIKEIFLKNKLYIFALLIIVAITIIIISLYQALVFQVTSTSPRNGGNVNIGSSIIVINLNKKIKAVSKDQVVASSDIIKSINTDSKAIRINTKDVVEKNNYIIFIKDIESENGEKISFRYNFAGKYISFAQQSNEIKKESIKETDSGNFTDRAAEILPKTTDKYSLTYDIFPEPSQKGKYIKITGALLVLNYQENDLNLLRSYKNEALRYLRSNGVNPNDYVIEWFPRAAQNL